MDGRIGHLHCRYQLIGPSSSASAVTARLDHLARERVVEILADAFDQALGEDPTVYVLRRVQAPVALNLAGGGTDVHLARLWAERLAGAVVRSIAKDPNDGTNLVRFADQADYVAHFAADLLQGRTWRLWFYGPFASRRAGNTADTLRLVLLDNREHLPAILGYLHRYNTLEKLLAALDEDTLQVLWSRGLGTDTSPTPESVRPLFASALRLVDRLGLWRRPRPTAETLFHTYLATGPPLADWRDRSGLAMAVLAVLRFLAAQGYLERPDDVHDDPFVSRLDQTLSDFDWLDAEGLRASVLNLLAGPVRQRTDLPLRPGGRGPTPRQRKLLADLAASLLAGRAGLDRSRPDSPANALQLYAWLVAHAPRWADDALAPGMIQRLLSAWMWLAQSRTPGQALRRLRQRDVKGALRTLPESGWSSAAGVFKFLAGLGEPGLAFIEALASGEMRRKTGQAPAQSDLCQWNVNRASPATEAGIETGCAGVFLLLRAILDARLPWLIESADYPPQGVLYPEPRRRAVEGLTPLSALLIALGLRWAGEPGLVEGQLDAGLSLLAGLEEALPFERLGEIWASIGPEDHARFQAALLRILAGQRSVRGSVLHLYRLALGDGHTALVAGDETGSLWPLGRLAETPDASAEVVAAWLDVWQAATGHRPTVVTAQSLATALQGVPDVVAVPEAASPAGHDTDDRLSLLPGGDGQIPPPPDLAIRGEPEENSCSIELEAAHRTGHEALLAAWAALEDGRLGLPEADLTIALTAMASLRVWARWLRQFAASSVPYLLANFIRRPGWVYTDDHSVLVEMEPRPLDIVIDMAGYTADLERIPWLGQRRVRFQRRGS